MCPLVPDSVILGSTQSRVGQMRARQTSRRVQVFAIGAFVASGLSACASTAGGPRGVAMRGGADSSLAAAVARERAGGTTTSSAIGIPPFQLLAKSDGKNDGMSAIGYAIADLLTTDLARSPKVTLVERGRLSDILRELDMVRTGRIDSSTAPRVGKLLRARRLVLGSVDTMGRGELRLSMRLADVESGTLDASLDARAPLNDVLIAEKALAFRLFDLLGVTLTPAERAAIEARPATSVAAITAYGRGVQAELSGDRRRAIDEFERAFTTDPFFQSARDRADQVKADARRSADAPAVMPGVRTINAPVSGTVDRVNRPIDLITSLSRPLGGPGDPSFPSTIVTVVVTVTRP